MEIIECCVQWNSINLLKSLAIVSKNAQKMIIDHNAFAQTVKNWGKKIDEIIVESHKEKKAVKK